MNHEPGFHLSCDENLSEGWGPPLSTGLGRVAALEATTGAVVWYDAPPEGDTTRRGAATRGVAYWSDGQDERIIAVVGSSLVALNAKTGARYSDFGDGGEVDLVQGYDDRIVES